MEFLGQLAVILVLVSAVSAQGSGPPQPEITKDLLRERIKEFRNNVEGYVGNLRDLAGDLVEKDIDEISSEEYGHLAARVPEAFVDGSHLYSSTMEYARDAIEKLWLEIMNHNQGVQDGFESDYLKCSQLISFAESYNWDDPSFVPSLMVDYQRAWILMAEDWKCLAYEFEGVFETCDKLTRRHVEGGMTLEDAVEGLGKLILGLTRLEDTGSLFYHAVQMIFPHLVPDFGAGTGGPGPQSGDGGSQSPGSYASKRNMLVRALEHMLKLRNGGNPPPPGGNPPPPTGSPPTSGENHPPPPPPGHGGSRRSYLERALKHMFEMRSGGNPPPPGGNPPPPTGSPPTSGENPPPPPPPGNGGNRRRNLERALDQLLRVRNEGNPPPPGVNPPTSGENPPPPPPPGNGGGPSGQTRSLAAILRKLNLHK